MNRPVDGVTCNRVDVVVGNACVLPRPFIGPSDAGIGFDHVKRTVVVAHAKPSFLRVRYVQALKFFGCWKPQGLVALHVPFCGMLWSITGFINEKHLPVMLEVNHRRRVHEPANHPVVKNPRLALILLGVVNFLWLRECFLQGLGHFEVLKPSALGEHTSFVGIHRSIVGFSSV